MTYQKGFAAKKVGDIVDFQIAGSAQRPDVPKFVVAQLLTVDEGGERTLAEMKAAVRTELAQRGGIHRYVDTLRKQTYVSMLLDDAGARRAESHALTRATSDRAPCTPHPTVARASPSHSATCAASGRRSSRRRRPRAKVRAAADLVFVGPSGRRLDVDEANGHVAVRRVTPADAGRFAGRAIERAVALALEGHVDGIVTAPIDKAALLAGGYAFPGHTEMLATLTGRRVAMMLAATQTAGPA